MTRDEKNRRIAEWLGWKGIIVSAGVQWKDGTVLGLNPSEKHGPYKPIPDFYESEAANAMVIDRLLGDAPDNCHTVEIRLWRTGFVEVFLWQGINGKADDRKTAICEAFLKWIDSLQNIPEHLRSGGAE